jgi:AraC-like DNA-binding protein
MSVWDVAARPAVEQFDYWREVICQAFVPLAPERTTERTGFSGQVEARALGTLNRARLQSLPQRVAHGRREVSSSRGEFYFVNLQLSGRCLVRQGRRESIVERGRFAVVDTTEPYFFDFDADWRMLSFRVPHEQLRNRLSDPAVGTGIGIDATTGTGRVVSALMRSLWELDEATDSCAAAELEQSFCAVAAVAMTTAAGVLPGGRAPHEDTRAAVLRFVAANLNDPDLSVSTVCRRFAISPRLLHKLFEQNTRPFAETVRTMRLDRCARLIADPHTRASITEIAARHGYPDPASFSRAFRRQFGVAPRDLRGRPPGDTTQPPPAPLSPSPSLSPSLYQVADGS